MRWIKAKLSDLYDKIVKEQKPAGFIARDWALGVFVGSAIPFGFQIYISRFRFPLFCVAPRLVR
jgi:hypothetical protein